MHVKGRGTKPKAPWWTEELETIKREVVDLHHQLHAAKRQGLPLDQILEARKSIKELYASKMRDESTRHFREFCELQTKENVWSLTNRLLKTATPRRPPVTLNRDGTYTTDSQETAKALLDHFYPGDSPDTLPRHHELRSDMTNSPQSHYDPPFTQEEVLECLRQMNPKKAPGLDNLTSDICLQFATDYPRLLTDILNRCLALQHFPNQWKTAFVKIIPKPGKSDYSALESFRPIGLIPVFGKLLEKLFIRRVTYHAQRNNLLNKFQFGFREQTNTCEAINTALDIIRQAKSNKQLSIAISLDIKAAFDNAWWPALFHRLRHIQCPNNIFGLIQDYVRDREVILDFAGGRVTKTMSKGCIQGSTCGPVLWNIILDELLDTKLPAGCHIQAFADDVLLVVTAASAGKLESAANLALHHIVEWGRSVKLAFGPTKTKLIAFTPKAKTASINIDGHRLCFVPEVKLLGVILDEKLNFGKHVKHVVNRAVRIFNTLCMYSRPTWGAHPENISTIYQQVIVPTITYAAGIWGHVAQKRCIRRALESMQRGFAIKAIRGFRANRASVAQYSASHPEVNRAAVASYSASQPEVNQAAVSRYRVLHPEVNQAAVSRYRYRYLMFTKSK
ncbi:unnamed protein product [Parnassius apollo]|uniref:(apollo) hypothetical protein n=1 Tax=Parnassius apollo TaxID=110799 RepID=A0A8S3XMQ3_PARAO|nr:unnamed protein product [Parnassius apollo]